MTENKRKNFTALTKDKEEATIPKTKTKESKSK